jgi:hypothetical protein
MTYDLFGYSGKLRNDNHYHLQLASLPVHQHGDIAVRHCTNMVRSKTRHIARSASRQGGSEGKLENVAMSLCACESGGAVERSATTSPIL